MGELLSMTGFGRASFDGTLGRQEWEARSVNSRYLDLKWRLPPWVRAFEASFEREVKKVLNRGRVELSLTFTPAPSGPGLAKLNKPMALAMLGELEDLARQAGHSFTPDISRLLGMPFVWEDKSLAENEDAARELSQGLGLALVALRRARVREGAALYEDLSRRFGRLTELVTRIEAMVLSRREARVAAFRDKLSAAAEALSAQVSEERLASEVVIYADRLDVSEERTRLATHLKALGEVLAKGTEAGKRLDFFFQECFREINTLGNKAADAEVSALVVEVKTELEKCREQAANVE